MPEFIDLRSDTVTQPTPAMRAAMYTAELGDDVYGEDPTTNRLEELAAARLGKEAALFVPSGTMGNLIALLTHCTHRGEEVLLGEQSHIFHYEVGGAAAVGGLLTRNIPNDDTGMVSPALVEAAIRGSDIHEPHTRLLCLENTQNRCGGTVLNKDQLKTLASVAHRHEVNLHLDGARIFNAATYLGIEVSELVEDMDSVMFCLSKGLSAPVGSLLVSSAPFIARARRHRKLLGGAMRQAGVLAAAGIIALEQMVERLAEDHRNARKLAEGLAHIHGITITLPLVQTNIVIFGLRGSQGPEHDASAFISALTHLGVAFSNMGHGRIRAVTHYGITTADIERALSKVKAHLQDNV